MLESCAERGALVSETDAASSHLARECKDSLWTFVVDLDGTLTPTDTLYESTVLLLRANPLFVFMLPVWLLSGIARLKHEIARRALPAVDRLPYQEELIQYLRQERAAGSRIVLATAANQAVADLVAGHLGLFDQVLASNAERNLKGAEKAREIQRAVRGPYIYAGDSAADLPIWNAANGAILVAAGTGVRAQLNPQVPVVREFGIAPAGVADWVRAIRVHQWLKNILIFVPLLTAFSFGDMSRLAAAVMAFLSFSLIASATYIGNDLFDLESDRLHPRKRHRAFAAGRLSIAEGVVAAAALLTAGFVLATVIGAPFVAATLVYLLITVSYSWKLKRVVLLDALVLASLYTIRIVAGAAAIGVVTTSWLLAFSMFVFFSLALVKRCSELVSMRELGKNEARGRSYFVADLTVLWPLGVGAALAAIVVFGLFINSPDTLARYHSPTLLWLTAAGLLYWLSHLWLMTGRAKMHDDPLVFAVRDGHSRLALAFIVLSTLGARYIQLG